MVTLSCESANFISEPLGISFVNGYKTMYEADFQKMIEREPERWKKYVDSGFIAVVKQDSQIVNRTAGVKVHNFGEQQQEPKAAPLRNVPRADGVPAAHTVLPKAEAVEPAKENEALPKAESIDKGKVTKQQAAVPEEQQG